MNFIIIFITLALSNYLFQLVFDRDWMKAFDRTFFQGIALFYVWWVTTP